ncbi:MAG TPA: DUF4845 domain-containing protein [Burkholderiales bacterium]|nr:DUF4845 domain-containing protein [Burkholderiales bacterium]
MYTQRGLSLIGLLMVSAIAAFVAIVGFKLLPTYIEYFTIKRVVQDIANEARGGSVRDVQSAFSRRAMIDNIRSISGNDLEITKQGSGGFDIHAGYTVRVPLFGNVNACIDFDVDNGK